MGRNKFFIVSVLAMSPDLSKAEKVFYIYEMTPKAYLVQKHGSNLEATPFKSKAAAQAWMDQRLCSEALLA